MNWKDRITAAATPQPLTEAQKEVINSITNLLTQHAESGVINSEQLIKIKDLAANPARLKRALGWL